MEVNFSEGMEQVLNYGWEEAVRTGNLSIHTEHLLLGIIRLGRGGAYSALKECGVDTDRLKQMLEDSVRTGKTVGHEDFLDINLNDEAEILMDYALQEKDRRGDSDIHTIHFLLAVLFAGFGTAGRLLEDSFGLTYAALCNAQKEARPASQDTGEAGILEFIGKYRNRFTS